MRCPEGFEQVLQPPRLPLVMVAYVLRDETWERVVPAETATLPVPPDPIRVRHDAYFTALFAAVREATGRDLAWREVPNRYWRDPNRLEPWYEADLGGATVLVGPRKRVTSLGATRATPFKVDELRALALADEVTFSADGAWQCDRVLVRQVEVHAWTREQAVVYLTSLVQAVARD